MNVNDTVYEIVKLDTNLPVSVRPITRKSFRNVSSHWHRSLEINFYLEGEIDFIINGVRQSYGAHHICLINSEAIHRSEVTKDFAVKDEKMIGVTLLIGYDFIRGLVPDILDSIFVLDDVETEIEIRNSLLRLMRERKEEGFEYNNVRMLGTICDILLLLCQKCKRSKDIIKINTQRDTERIRGILTYIHENYDQNLVQYEVAQKFYFSREYFSKFFKKYAGMSFKEYLTRYRLIKSEKLLLDTDITILQIAMDCGFTDERQFISAFKKYYRMTPSQFRKEKKGIKQVTFL